MLSGSHSHQKHKRPYKNKTQNQNPKNKKEITGLPRRNRFFHALARDIQHNNTLFTPYAILALQANIRIYMDQDRTISDLRANPKNPRTISGHDFDHLKQSIKEFGDLSGIVRNNRTGQLVGGHQRIQAFKALGAAENIEIVKQFDEPTVAGTTAIGFVTLDMERYSYREVDWPEERELAANIAANRITGEFDNDLLAEVTYQISQMNPELLDLTGQTKKEIDKLFAQIGVGGEEQADDSEKEEAENEYVFAVTAEQGEQIAKALDHAKQTYSITGNEQKRVNGEALYYIVQQYLNEAALNAPEPTAAPRLDQI